MKKIVGFSKFTSKKGTKCCFVHCTEPLTDRELNNGSCGQKTDVVQLYDEALSDKVTPECLGKKLDVLYDVVAGRAYVRDITIS